MLPDHVGGQLVRFGETPTMCYQCAMRPILPGYVYVALDKEPSVNMWPRTTSSTAGEWGDREGGHSGVKILPCVAV
jgi:hypothetical protein